jgi:hypothetical protein
MDDPKDRQTQIMLHHPSPMSVAKPESLSPSTRYYTPEADKGSIPLFHLYGAEKRKGRAGKPGHPCCVRLSVLEKGDVYDLVSRAAVRRSLDVDYVREAIRTPGRIDDTHMPQTPNGVRADDPIPVRFTLPEGGPRAKTR